MENNYRMSELGFWVPVRDSREWVPVEDFAEAENQPRHDKRDARPASSDPPSAGHGKQLSHVAVGILGSRGAGVQPAG